jgi:SAM-dependent methyltransferase
VTPPVAPANERERLFELPSEYDALLEQGIRLSGEDRLFFVRGRVGDLLAHLPAGFRPHRVLDFGCGTGDTSRRFAEALPEAVVVGVDSSTAAIAWAEAHHGGPRVRFGEIASVAGREPFDLCYLNGVVHHVRPAERAALGRTLRDAVAPGGLVAIFENNPWNPGARMVMRRIPFDRDAVAVSPPELRRLVADAGFRPLSTRFLFYFPRALGALRRLEPLLARVPLGAQYWVLAARD